MTDLGPYLARTSLFSDPERAVAAAQRLAGLTNLN